MEYKSFQYCLPSHSTNVIVIHLSCNDINGSTIHIENLQSLFIQNNGGNCQERITSNKISDTSFSLYFSLNKLNSVMLSDCENNSSCKITLERNYLEEMVSKLQEALLILNTSKPSDRWTLTINYICLLKCK